MRLLGFYGGITRNDAAGFAPRRVGAFWGRKVFQVDVVAINEKVNNVILVDERKRTDGLV